MSLSFLDAAYTYEAASSTLNSVKIVPSPNDNYKMHAPSGRVKATAAVISPLSLSLSPTLSIFLSHLVLIDYCLYLLHLSPHALIPLASPAYGEDCSPDRCTFSSSAGLDDILSSRR